MGGCRCIFRNCPVGTARNPKMHFFRFPVRDSARLKKWAEMSDNASMVHLPVSQLKNKVVCARHFRDECFMNYMRNKLVAKAVPTLDRLKGGYAWDYDTNGSIPVMIELPQTKLPHMVPPKGFHCPLGLDDDIEVLNANDASLEVEEVLSADNSFIEYEDEEVVEEMPESVETLHKVEIPKSLTPVAHKRAATNQFTTNSKKPKILNFEAPENSTQYKVEQEMSFSMELADHDLEMQQEEGSLASTQVLNEEIEFLEVINVKGESTRISQVYDKAVNTDPIVCNEKGIQANVEDNTKHNKKREQDYLQIQLQQERTKYETLEQNMSQLVNQVQEAYCQAEVSKLQLDQANDDQLNLKLENQALSLSNEKAKAEITTLLSVQAELERRCEDLKQKYDTIVELKKQLESRNQALQQQQQQQFSTVSTSKNSPENQNLSSIVPTVGILTKAQLFNGIKKYLSSSMVALVRMEMFGSTERAWKPDEKQAALDLYGLGENVYRYFTDEWRFRLPGFRQVKEWFSDVRIASLGDDEEDL